MWADPGVKVREERQSWAKPVRAPRHSGPVARLLAHNAHGGPFCTGPQAGLLGPRQPLDDARGPWLLDLFTYE